MSVQRTSIPATEIWEVTSASKTSQSFEGTVTDGGSSTSVIILAASSVSASFAGSSTTIRSVELEYWHNEADLTTPTKTVEFVKVSSDPSATAAATLYSEVQNATGSDIYASKELHGVSRTKDLITLGDSETSEASQTMDTVVESSTHELLVGIRRKSTETGEGAVSIGGHNLVDGMGSPWLAAESENSKSPARFVITWEDTSATLDDNAMRYTTADPTDTSGQQTPRNSLGGYAAINNVYDVGTLYEPISPTQTTITMAVGSMLPNAATGIVQVGPEILRYGSIDRINRQLQNVTRGVSPGYGFPSGLYPRADVRLLDIDRLFNSQPTSDMVHYRCFAVVRPDTYSISNVVVYLRQNSSDDVAIDIGIEVSQFDTHTGTIDSDGAVGRLFASTTADVFTGFSSGFFEGGHVIIDPDGASLGPSHAIIESYDVTATRAEFIVDRDIPSFTAGTSFRINPAPAQTIQSDANRPVENSGRFLGFFSEGGSNEVTFQEHTDMEVHDLFYVWVRRTLAEGVSGKDDTGAIIIIEFDNSNLP